MKIFSRARVCAETVLLIIAFVIAEWIWPARDLVDPPKPRSSARGSIRPPLSLSRKRSEPFDTLPLSNSPVSAAHTGGESQCTPQEVSKKETGHAV